MEVFLSGGSQDIKSYIERALYGKKIVKVIYYKNAKKFDLGYQKIILEDGIKYMKELIDNTDFNMEKRSYQRLLDEYKFVLKEINKRLKTK